jgi:predicted porin
LPARTALLSQGIHHRGPSKAIHEETTMFRKTIGVLAASLLAGAGAHAQSSVTLFGIADSSLTYGKGSVSSRRQLGAGNLSGSRLGFRGSEDLGGGLRANFWLEAGMANDSGSGSATNTNNQASGAGTSAGLTFNRTSYVGLSSTRWGEVRLGRDYTPTFNGHVYYDPTLLTGAGVSQTGMGSLTIFAAPNGARASNAIHYLSPGVNGFAGELMYALGENASSAGATRNDGNYTGLRVGWSNAAVNLSLAAAHYKMSSVHDMDEVVLGATWVLGATKLWGILIRNDTGSANDMRGGLVGVTHAIGPWLLKASLSNSRLTNAAGARAGTTEKLMLGTVYSLSARTSLYATAAHTRNRDGGTGVPQNAIAVTGPNRGASAIDLGIRHTF